MGNELSDSLYKIQKGDCPWKLASKNLKTHGKPTDNEAIIEEMERLANINGCSDVNDFQKKFFKKLGLEINLAESIDTPSTQNSTSLPTNSSRIPVPDELKDSIKVADTSSTRVAKKEFIIPQKATFTEDESVEERVQRINSMKSDEERIIEYNKSNYDYEYYGIVDKKTCALKIYNKEGTVAKEFVCGVGKTKGDNLNSYYMDIVKKTKDAWKAEQNRYTTAGEFTLDEVSKTSNNYIGKDGKPKIMHLKGDNRGVRGGQLALHMLYKPSYKERKAAIDSPGLEDNRMSYGCVNLTEEDWNEMHKYLSEGNKVYVLPEEDGNKLQLEQQKDGSYKFAQQYHKDNVRGVTAETASNVTYDIRPENDPKYIAKQKRLLAQQEKSNSEPWYKRVLEYLT